jgi:hypothetical protein
MSISRGKEEMADPFNLREVFCLLEAHQLTFYKDLHMQEPLKGQ